MDLRAPAPLSTMPEFDPAASHWGAPSDTLRIPAHEVDAEQSDAALSHKLVGLMGRIEVHRENLREEAGPGNYLPAVRATSALVGELLAFDATARDLACVRDAVRFVAAGKVLAADLTRTRFFGLKRAALTPNQEDLCVWLLRDTSPLLRAYFRQLTDLFHLPAGRSAWEVIAAEFIQSTADLLRVIDPTL